MRVAVVLIIAAVAAVALYVTADMSGLATWAIDAQRGFQNQIAGAVRALKSGDPGAYFALLTATAAYGFVHALGPGHGKYLVGGVGFGTSISATRLLGLALASSVAQALWAILLVYGGFYLVEFSAHQMTELAEQILAPLSYLAIAFVGLVIIWRGLRSLPKQTVHHEHSHADCGCHSHGPTPDQAARVVSLRDAVALVASIAIRPCTGAIFLLVIAWQMDIKAAGAAAVVVMGLGTAGLTSIVALSSTIARRVTLATSTSMNGVHVVVPALQIFAGATVVMISLGLLGFVV